MFDGEFHGNCFPVVFRIFKNCLPLELVPVVKMEVFFGDVSDFKHSHMLKCRGKAWGGQDS
jgi:hypothetical protein